MNNTQKLDKIIEVLKIMNCLYLRDYKVKCEFFVYGSEECKGYENCKERLICASLDRFNELIDELAGG